MLKRMILGYLGANPTRSLTYGNIEGVGTKGRIQWLKDVEELGRGAA
jgi:hypothetical protein